MKKFAGLVVPAVGLIATAAGISMAGVAAQIEPGEPVRSVRRQGRFRSNGRRPGVGRRTTWVAADGKGTVVVMIRAVPYFRIFQRMEKPVKTWGEDGASSIRRTACTSLRRIGVGQRSERSCDSQIHRRTANCC